MKQLLEAAKGFGVELEGVLSKEKARAPDRPALAYVKRGQHGHFIVIRPVGLLGRMIQVFDNGRDAEVIDMADLTASSDWTGLILRPVRADWPLWLASLSTILAGGLGFNLIRLRLHRQARMTEECCPLIRQADSSIGPRHFEQLRLPRSRLFR